MSFIPSKFDSLEEVGYYNFEVARLNSTQLREICNIIVAAAKFKGLKGFKFHKVTGKQDLEVEVQRLIRLAEADAGMSLEFANCMLGAEFRDCIRFKHQNLVPAIDIIKNNFGGDFQRAFNYLYEMNQYMTRKDPNNRTSAQPMQMLANGVDQIMLLEDGSGQVDSI
jgi:hypothetical protein